MNIIRLPRMINKPKHNVSQETRSSAKRSLTEAAISMNNNPNCYNPQRVS